MKKRVLILSLTLALLTTPAVLAFYDVDSDKLDEATGHGVAVIHVMDNIYAMVWYVDLDGNGHYSAGDDRYRTVYFRA